MFDGYLERPRMALAMRIPSMAELMIPPEAFLEFVWGLNKDEIELIGEMRDAAELLEPPVTEEEEEIVAEEETE